MFLLFRDQITERLTLSQDEATHARARRLAPGDPVHVGDGRSERYAGRLAPDGRTVLLEGSAPVETRVEPARVLCTAIPSGGRWDWLLQKAVEVGVTHIHPVIFERSERRDAGRRPERIVASAAAQSRRFLLPTVEATVPLTELHAHLGGADRIYLLAGDAASPLVASDAPPGSTPACIVGPEGCLTPAERALVLALGAVERTLGSTVLRVETAAVVALGRLLV